MERIDETLNDLKGSGIIAVIRCDSGESALEIAEAVSNGGVRFVEITMTVPGAVDVLSALSGREDIVLGAGTVLDAEAAALCIAKGARFIVSPALDAATVRLCNRSDVLCIPGIGSVTEALNAMELGARVVKLFPSEVLGPGFIEAIRRPLPGARIIPTGTLPLESLESWFKAGAFAVGVGGPLTAPRYRERLCLYQRTCKKICGRSEESEWRAGQNLRAHASSARRSGMIAPDHPRANGAAVVVMRGAGFPQPFRTALSAKGLI